MGGRRHPLAAPAASQLPGLVEVQCASAARCTAPPGLRWPQPRAARGPAALWRAAPRPTFLITPLVCKPLGFRRTCQPAAAGPGRPHTGRACSLGGWRLASWAGAGWLCRAVEGCLWQAVECRENVGMAGRAGGRPFERPAFPPRHAQRPHAIPAIWRRAGSTGAPSRPPCCTGWRVCQVTQTLSGLHGMPAALASAGARMRCWRSPAGQTLWQGQRQSEGLDDWKPCDVVLEVVGGCARGATSEGDGGMRTSRDKNTCRPPRPPPLRGGQPAGSWLALPARCCRHQKSRHQ